MENDRKKAATQPPVFDKDFRVRRFPPEVLLLLVKCISDGDVGKLDVLWSYILKEREAFSDEIQLQQAKYAAVAAVAAVISRVADGAVIYEHAAALGEFFIYGIESARDIDKIYELVYNAFLGLTRLTYDSIPPNAGLSAPINRARNYISENLHYELRLADIASECGLSPSYLSALFKKETGMTVSEYIMREKLREAEYMLQTGRYKISEICYYLNFCSQSYFTHYFKKYYGETPARYMKRYGSSTATL